MQKKIDLTNLHRALSLFQIGAGAAGLKLRFPSDEQCKQTCTQAVIVLWNGGRGTCVLCSEEKCLQVAQKKTFSTR